MAHPDYPQIAFLWPALVAASASEVASAIAEEFAQLAAGVEPKSDLAETQWTTRNSIVVELPSMRLRDFSVRHENSPTLICAPFALHGATIVDFACGHSLVAALGKAGLSRLFVTDWCTATPEMRFFSIDNYLADLNVAVDEIGGAVDLVGLCQGGWMALAYAARFPGKVRKLVLAGAPIDVDAGESDMSRRAASVPLSVFRQLVKTGGGRILGQRALKIWGPAELDEAAIRQALQLPERGLNARLSQLEARFRQWYAGTLDLPGTYYLEVVERLFKRNQLAKGDFVALGHRIDLAAVRVPVFLLAADGDDVVVPAQLFAIEGRIGTPTHSIKKAVAPCGHLGLFMGATTLTHTWPDIARWLAEPAPTGRLTSPDLRSVNFDPNPL
jgi:poly(3-hydroxyalkanoate) synthetase